MADMFLRTLGLGFGVHGEDYNLGIICLLFNVYVRDNGQPSDQFNGNNGEVKAKDSATH